MPQTRQQRTRATSLPPVITPSPVLEIAKQLRRNQKTPLENSVQSLQVATKQMTNAENLADSNSSNRPNNGHSEFIYAMQRMQNIPRFSGEYPADVNAWLVEFNSHMHGKSDQTKVNEIPNFLVGKALAKYQIEFLARDPVIQDTRSSATDRWKAIKSFLKDSFSYVHKSDLKRHYVKILNSIKQQPKERVADYIDKHIHIWNVYKSATDAELEESEKVGNIRDGLAEQYREIATMDITDSKALIEKLLGAALLRERIPTGTQPIQLPGTMFGGYGSYAPYYSMTHPPPTYIGPGVDLTTATPPQVATTMQGDTKTGKPSRKKKCGKKRKRKDKKKYKSSDEEDSESSSSAGSPDEFDTQSSSSESSDNDNKRKFNTMEATKTKKTAKRLKRENQQLVSLISSMKEHIEANTKAFQQLRKSLTTSTATTRSPNLPRQTPMRRPWFPKSQQQISVKMCFNCNKPGHHKKDCPEPIRQTPKSFNITEAETVTDTTKEVGELVEQAHEDHGLNEIGDVYDQLDTPTIQYDWGLMEAEPIPAETNKEIKELNVIQSGDTVENTRRSVRIPEIEVEVRRKRKSELKSILPAKLDTGATISLVNAEWYRQNQKRLKLPKLTRPDIIVRLGDSSLATTFGKIKMKIHVGKREIEHIFYVFDMKYQMVIGMDLMTALGAELNLEKGVFRFKKNSKVKAINLKLGEREAAMKDCNIISAITVCHPPL